MKRLTRFAIVAALLIGGLTLLAAGWGWANQTAVAQTDVVEPEAAQTTNEPVRKVTVNGQGRVAAQPDTAVVRFGVQTQAEEAAEALDENSARMQEVISATLEAGVDEADIQTQGIRLQPQYRGGDDETPPELTGYQASNIVEVTVRDLEQLGGLLDAVVEAGSNTIDSIRFEISETDELLTRARAEAMNNARATAEQLAGLADAELGDVLTIDELGGQVPQPIFLEQTTAVADRAVPISPGRQFVETSVQVTWRLR